MKFFKKLFHRHRWSICYDHTGPEEVIKTPENKRKICRIECGCGEIRWNKDYVEKKGLWVS